LIDFFDVLRLHTDLQTYTPKRKNLRVDLGRICADDWFSTVLNSLSPLSPLIFGTISSQLVMNVKLITYLMLKTLGIIMKHPL